MASQLELKVFDRMVVARMNKYYHQIALQRFRWLQAAGTTITLFGLAIGGAKFTFLTEGFVSGFAVFAILWTVVSIGFGLSSKISLHENLFREFGELEGEFAALNARIEGGEDVKKIEPEVLRWQAVHFKLEAKQPNAFGPLWKHCVDRVRREKWGDEAVAKKKKGKTEKAPPNPHAAGGLPEAAP